MTDKLATLDRQEQPDEILAESTFALEFSPEIGELFGALAKAHKAFKPVKKKASNPFYKSKYADLAEIIEATGDGLSDNGLAVVQFPANYANGQVSIISVLGHSSNQWVRGTLQMPVGRQDAQGVGSAITYGRRYSYGALLNVASEDDDDGNAAVGKNGKDAKTQEEYHEDFLTRSDNERIADYQVKAFWDACKLTGKSNDQITNFLKGLQHVQVEQLVRKEFNAAIKWANQPSTYSQATLEESVKVVKAKKAVVHNFAKLFATAKTKGIPEEDVRRVGYEIYKVDSLSKLTPEQFSGLEEWVENQDQA